MTKPKEIETRTKVKWKAGDESYTGTVVAGPFHWKPEEAEERKKNGLDVGPYHNVYCNEMSNYHQVITKYLKVID